MYSKKTTYWRFWSSFIKAFDILNHKKINIFLDKTIRWFHSYFKKRAFLVSLNIVIFGSRDGQLQSSPRWYSILGRLLFLWYINNILQALSNNHAYLYDYSIFINLRTLRKSKMFWINNLCMLMYAIGLLIIIYQFILVKIKLNVFFSVSELNITCNWSHNLKTIDEFVLVSHLARIERNKKRYVSSCVSFHIYLGSRSIPSLHGYTVINKEV